ncbi:MAG: hypothetical protein ACREAA_20930 [Candidatus Polarisedimenticolia bacterium]
MSSPAFALPLIDTLSEEARPYRAGLPEEDGDRVAVSLKAAQAKLLVPLAHVAEAIVRTRAHVAFGYARLSDYCRERHGRSARWLRDHAALHECFERSQALRSAVTGEDGGRPLSLMAALAIGTGAEAADEKVWIERGRRATLAALKGELSLSSAGGFVDPEERVEIRLRVPRAVKVAFDEALGLYRALEGGEASVESFVEALVAESLASRPMVFEDVRRARSETSGKVDDGRGAPWSGSASWALRLAGSSLEKLDALALMAGQGDHESLDRQMRALLQLDNELELRLGEVLAKMGERRAWRALGYDTLGHYAERRLGCRVRLLRTGPGWRARSGNSLS